MKISPRLLATLAACCLAHPTAAQLTDRPGAAVGQQKVAEGEGGFLGTLADLDGFGSAVSLLGDVDGNGTIEVAVGTPGDDDGGNNRGAVWIVSLMAADAVKVSDASGGFSAGGLLDDGDRFGAAVAGIGDLDGDGFEDLVVGAPGDDDGGSGKGAFYVVFLTFDLVEGIVVDREVKISGTTGGFNGTLDVADAFGSALSSIGDVNGDGVDDLAVGVSFDDDEGPSRGAVYVVFMSPTGLALGDRKISSFTGGFGGDLDDFDLFGSSVAGLGDLDGDGIPDLAVGAFGDDDGGASHGAVWILFLNADGTVADEEKISSLEGGFGGEIDNGEAFGVSVAAMGDVDGDSVPDLAVGVLRGSDGGPERGAAWLIYLNADGSVDGEVKLSDLEGNFEGELADGDRFGFAVSSAGDLDGDGGVDLLAGAPNDDSGGADRGALWTVLLEGPYVAKSAQRNGSGVNAPCFSTVSEAILGENWMTGVIAGEQSTVGIVGYTGALEGLMTAYGELLVDVQSADVVAYAESPPPVFISLPVPNNPDLVGFRFSAQGVRFGRGVPELCNALDVQIGLAP